uniref:Uncharacterized protein n=1 Tax=Arundo donax TaxID=35708 RepID=A0A0A8Y6J7_ARUDO
MFVRCNGSKLNPSNSK